MPIPHSRGAMLGRAAAMASVMRGLDTPGLSTIWGPGGIGKTRLAVTITQAFRERGQRVIFASVPRDLTSDRLIRRLVQLAEIPLEYHSDALPIERLAAWLPSSEIALLVLDEAEVSFAAVCEVVRCLHARGITRILVTSRVSLELPGERLELLEPLGASDSLTLFEAVANVELTDPQLTQRVVERLQGLPLAIELAAARLDVLSLAALEQRMHDPLPVLCNPASLERNGALERSIRDTWDGLSGDAQETLAECAVFGHHFSLEAAEAVCATRDLPVLDAVHLLTRRCLLRCHQDADGAIRFQLGPFVRAFLETLGDVHTAVVARHSTWFGEHAIESLLERHRGAADGRWIDQEEEDLTQAAKRASEDPTLPAIGHTQCVAALLFQGLPHDNAEALAWTTLDQVADRPVDPRAVAKIWEALSSLAHRRADPTAAIYAIRKGLEWARRGGRGAIEIECSQLGILGTRLGECGDLDGEKEAFQRSLALALKAQNSDTTARTRIALTLCEDWRDLWRPQRSLHQLRLALEEASETATALRLSLNHRIAQLQLSTGAPDKALAQIEAALKEPASHVGLLVSEIRHTQGYALLSLGRLEEADQVMASSESDFSLHGDVFQAASATLGRVIVALQAGRPFLASDLLASVEQSMAVPSKAWLHLTLLYWALRSATAAMLGDAAAEAQARQRVQALDLSVLNQPCFASTLPLLEPLLGLIARHQALQGGAILSPDPEQARRLACMHAVQPRHAAPVQAIADWGVVLHAAAAEMERAWLVLPGGAGFMPPDQALIPTRQHRAASSILAALTTVRLEDPGTPVSPEALIEAGWPGERLLRSAARNRLHVALNTLRRRGLQILRRVEGGYQLAPELGVRWGRVESG